jgi:hypothetical protein
MGEGNYFNDVGFTFIAFYRCFLICSLIYPTLPYLTYIIMSFKCVSRIWQHRSEDPLGPDRYHLLRHLRDAPLPHVGQPDGHLPGSDLPVLLLKRLLRSLQGWTKEEGCCPGHLFQFLTIF